MVSLPIWIAIACFGLALAYIYLANHRRTERLRHHQRYEARLQDVEKSYNQQLLDAEKRELALAEKCDRLEQERDDLQRTLSTLQSRYANALIWQKHPNETNGSHKLHSQRPWDFDPDLQPLKDQKAILLQEITTLEQKQNQLRQEIEDEQFQRNLMQEKVSELVKICDNLRQEQRELQQENAQLEELHYDLMEQEALTQQCQFLERTKDTLESQLAQTRSQLGDCEEANQQYVTHVQHLRRIALVPNIHGNHRNTAELFYARIDTNFDTVIQAVEFAENLNSDILEIWDSARQSAYESNFLRPHDVYLNLQALAWFGRDYFARNGQLGEGIYQTLKALQCDYVAGESKSVQNNGKLKNQRLFWNGKLSKIMLEHVRVGTGTGADRNLRIYFALNPHTQKVEIGHCGKHLDTQSS